MAENKKRNMILFACLFAIFFLISFVNAADLYSYYFEDPVVPQQQTLDVKNSLLVDSFSGAALYTHPINVPKGTNGLQPTINLFYNSQSVTQRPGILGTGWSFSENYVQRNTNYTVSNTSDDSFILFLDGTQYDLRYAAGDGRYHTKIESFLYIQNVSGGNNDNGDYWIVKTKDGTSYRFGFYNFSGMLSNQYNYTWRWYLDFVNDTYGNSIFYNYSQNPFPSDKGVAYLDSIEYNNDKTRKINFQYQSSDMPHLRTAYENGNKVTQSRMLAEIDINASSSAVRKYIFAYGASDNNGTLSSVSNITEYGNDSTSSLPSVQFGYLRAGDSFQPTTWNYPGCTASNSTGCFSDTTQDMGTRLVDINGDGLVDVVRAYSDTGGSHIFAWINNGTGWTPTNWSFPGCVGINESGCFLDHGSDTGARLIDINGDGLIDVARAYSADGVQHTFAWINNGTGWTPTNWSFPGCNSGDSDGCFTATTQDTGTRLVDVNGDGLIDVVRAQVSGVPPTSTTWAWINNGTGWTPTNWSFPGCNSGDSDGCFADGSQDMGTRLIDINGDGLVDVARAQSSGQPVVSTTFAWINNGTGWTPTNWSFPGCNSGDSDGCFAATTQDTGARLVDVNGDGLIDVVRAQTVQGQGGTNTWAWINNGTGWTPTNWSFPGCVGINYSGCFSDTTQDMGTRLVDLNGDGLIDVVRAQTDGGQRTLVWTNNGGANYLINKINFSLGGEVSLSYQKSTSQNNVGIDNMSDINFNVWLVLNVTKNNSVTGAQNVMSNTIYNFTKGAYDYKNKEFRGFNFAEEKTADKVTQHWFHQDDARNGKEYQTEILDNQSNPFQITQKIWNSTIQNGYYVVNLAQESEQDYDGVSNNSKIKNKTYGYDTFGNIINKHNFGDVNSTNDDTFEYYTYVTNTSLWIVTSVTNYSLVDSDNATFLRNTLYSYDGLAFGVAPTKGDVTKKENWLSGGNNTIILSSYDSFGNVINSTDENGKVSKYSYGTRDTTNTFPDSMTNAQNQITNYFYDVGAGNILAEKDSNSIIKNYTFDPLSIEKTAVLPFDSPALPTQEYSYNFTAANDEGKIIVKQREQSGQASTLDTYKFYDGFGRLIQTRTEAQNSKQIDVDTYYDELGRVKQQSNPYYVAFSSNYSIADATVPKTTFYYDVLDRIVKIANPDGTFKNLSYDHWNVTVYDENGNRKDFVLNAHSKIIRVIEYNTPEIYQTRYYYNGVDELTGIIDALNNTFNYTYDTLGRKNKMVDPDMGTWMYQYDAAGNLIKQIDNNATNISTNYDGINRKIAENTTERNVTYVYDSTINNTLSRALASDFFVNYTYDNRSRKVSEIKTIDSITNVVNLTYDASDRVTSEVLPSGEIINFTYNEQGLLSSIQGVTDAIYNEKNNPTGITYNNTLTTNFTYDSNNSRLQQIKTANKQNLNYQYDSVGNVKEISQSSDKYSVVNVFNNSLTSENLTFSGNQNITRYLNIPANASVLSAYMNLSGQGFFPSNSIVLYYDFSSSRELVSGIYNLTQNEGAVSYNGSNCKLGNCAQIFVNNNLRIPANAFTAFNGSYTFNFWGRLANATVPINDEYILFSPNGSHGRISDWNSTSWNWNSYMSNTNRFTGKTHVDNGTYFMFTVMRNDSDGNVSVYVNAQLEDATTLGILNESSYSFIVLGANSLNNASEMTGQLDEMGFWNNTLNQTEIANLYNNGNGQEYGLADSGQNGTLNPFLEVGTSDGKYEWNFSGTFTQLNNRTNNFAYAITNALNNGTCICTGCIASQGNCTIPFIFHSNDSGTLVYSDLSVNFTATGYNDSIVTRNTTMNYDSLNRLTRMQIVDTQITTANFLYDAIGNMINMTGTQNAEFYYDGGKAHAPSSVVYY